MLTDEQIKLRATGITATEIAAIAGLNEWRSPMAVYLDKLGLVEPQPDNPAMRMGRRLEPVVVEEYCERTGYQVEECGTLVHPDYPFIIGTPDRLVIDRPIGLEVKTVGIRQAHRWGEEWSDEAPEEYILQCQFYLAITNRDEWHIAALFLADREMKIYVIERDRELEEWLIQLASDFWHNHILVSQPPPLDSDKASERYLQLRYPRHNDLLIPADHQAVEFIKGWQKARGLKLANETEEETFKHLLMDKIGDAAGIKGDNWRVSWKMTRSSEVTDWEALALELKPTPEQIKAFTKHKPGTRRFLVKFDVEEGKENVTNTESNRSGKGTNRKPENVI